MNTNDDYQYVIIRVYSFPGIILGIKFYKIKIFYIIKNSIINFLIFHLLNKTIRALKSFFSTIIIINNNN